MNTLLTQAGDRAHTPADPPADPPAEEPARTAAEQDASTEEPAVDPAVHEAAIDLAGEPVGGPGLQVRARGARREFPVLLLVAFIDSVRERHGVEPVCRVLSEYIAPIHPSTYYAARSRPASARALRDAYLGGHISRLFHDKDAGRGLAGARKMTHLLSKEGISVARCTVERLMKSAGLKGARRGRRYVTTRPGQPSTTAARPADLVRRDFDASAPNELWLVDFTYIPTATGMVFTAFVSDACTRAILGWRTTARHDTDLPLDALEMALWVRANPTSALPEGSSKQEE
ncbi:Integrase core domain-containing protein, partial [Quadrisphaera granulorum]